MAKPTLEVFKDGTMPACSTGFGLVALMADRLWTLQEAAEFLRVPSTTLYRQRHVGAAPGSLGVRVGRHVRFDPADIRDWLNGQKGGTGRIGPGRFVEPPHRYGVD